MNGIILLIIIKLLFDLNPKNMVNDIFFHYEDHVDVSELSVFYCVLENIHSEKELYNEYDKQFKFPYFGFNWDALRDSLCGLDEWMREKRIIIIHKKIPLLGEKEFKIYISVLYDVCELWAKYPDILEFKVFFPIVSKSAIEEILRNINSRF